MSGDLFSEEAEIVGCELGGRYRVEEVIGKGGFAVVYKGRDINLSMDVAIKVPRPEIRNRRGFHQKFEEEKRFLTQCREKMRGLSSIVFVSDAGIFEDIPYLVLEYMPGRSLRTTFTRDGRQTIDDVLKWLPAIAEALDGIHEMGVVHLDVKPSNILYDRENQAMLSDFGIARVMRQTAGDDGGGLPGSPNYMAPEADGGEVTGKYDQYSLGVIVYQALTGERPQRQTPGSTAIAPPDDLVTGITPGCSDAVMRALDPDPNRRFPTCMEFALAVQGATAFDGTGIADPKVGEDDVWDGEGGDDVSQDGRVIVLEDEPGDTTKILTTTRRSPGFKISKTTWYVIASASVSLLLLLVAILGKGDGGEEEAAGAPTGGSGLATVPDVTPSGPPSPDTPDPTFPRDPADRGSGWTVSQGGRTVTFTSPPRQRASVTGTTVLFRGTVTGGRRTDVMFLGDVRVVVDPQTREFSQEVEFPSLGPQSIRLTIEYLNDVVLRADVHVDLR